MKRTYRRYLAAMAFVSIFLFGAVCAFNYIVNPIGLYSSPVIVGFNDTHPAGALFSRLQKIEAIKKLQPDALVTGSSRADNGLDLRAGETIPEGLRPYNAGLAASSIREQRAMLEFAQAVHPLKLAVITLDYFAFNARRPENAEFEPARLSPEALRPWRAFIDTYDTVTSIDTLIASFKHLRYRKHPERYSVTLPNGRRDPRDLAMEIKNHGAASLFRHDPAASAIQSDNFTTDYSDQPGDNTYKHFEAMLDLVYSRGIKTILIISPVHFETQMSDERLSVFRQEEQWKRSLVLINKAVAQRYHSSPYPIWDFDYPNAVTTEPVPPENEVASPMKWFWDPGHYNASLGDIVLRKAVMGSQEHPGFGKRLEE